MKKIFIAGHRGMVGSALLRLLKKKNKVFTIEKKKLDLTNQEGVLNLFRKQKFDKVYIAAAKVGGIYANNQYPADFMYQNLMIACNLINSSHLTKVKKVLYLGSNCSYPKYATQPIKESELLSGKLEPTNEPYSIAKISGLKLCESYNRQFKNSYTDFRSVIPTNLYGVNDNYHSKNSHVIPALIKKIHFAKKYRKSKILIWGSGKVLREFLFVDDLAKCCLKIMNISKKDYLKLKGNKYSHINIGSGKEISIFKLANKISKVIGYKGKILFDKSYPDGAPRKLLNSSKLKKIAYVKFTNFDEGLKISYKDFLKNEQ